MISNFNEEAQEILVKAKLEMLELRHPYVGTEHLVLAILNTNNELTKKLEKYNLTYNSFKLKILNIIGKGTKKSEFFLHTPLLKKVIENAIMDSKDNNNGIVTTAHLFTSLLDVGEGIAIRIFISMNLDLDNIYEEFTSKIYEYQKQKKKLLIEELGINLNEEKTDPVIGRDKEIAKIEEILCRRTKNNPLLIGEPGVGKTAIIEELAKKIESGNVPNILIGKKIFSLDMASAVAGTKYRGEFEERMKKIISEIEENEEIILFIDEIHTLIGAGGAEGAIDASNILKPSLARGKIRCIGATTLEEYKKHFKEDKALERRFQPVNIDEPSVEETKNILYRIKPIYEEYHNVLIKNETIDDLIDMTEKYIYKRYRPDKQIDILDEVCSKVNINYIDNNTKEKENLKEIRNKKNIYIKENNLKKAYEYKIKETKFKNIINKAEVTTNDVALVISGKSKIPLYEVLKENSKTVDKIENTLKRNIVGQNEVIKKLINITKRIKLGYKENKCISLLFIGPSGVGKTKLATLYGEILSEQKPIKIDMSEFSESTSISRFMGSNPGLIGYNDNNYILSMISDNPNAVIILDEIDKAHPEIINLLYQILEDSIIKDAQNNIINLKNNIIIMTSNKGTESISIGFNNTEYNIEDINATLNNAIIGRIDDIIVFNRLKKYDIIRIIKENIKQIKEKYKNQTINISDNITQEIIKESEYEKYGARKIKSIIQNKIENIIIDKIIEKEEIINIDSLFSK